MASEVIHFFLNSITAETGLESKGEEIENSNFLPTQFFTALRGRNKNSTTLCRALLQPRTCFDGDLLLIPYHQDNHWSIIGVFFKKSTIVHCDSCASRDADETAFRYTLEYLPRASVYLDQPVNIKRFKLISLSEAGLKQNDSTSCGLFTYVNAFSLQRLKDFFVPILLLLDIGL